MMYMPSGNRSHSRRHSSASLGRMKDRGWMLNTRG